MQLLIYLESRREAVWGTVSFTNYNAYLLHPGLIF